MLDRELAVSLTPVTTFFFLFKTVFRIRIRPDPKLFGLKDTDPDPKLLISDPDLAPDPDPPLFHTKLKNMF